MYKCECVSEGVWAAHVGGEAGRTPSNQGPDPGAGQLQLQQPEMEARQAAGRAASPNNNSRRSFGQ